MRSTLRALTIVVSFLTLPALVSSVEAASKKSRPNVLFFAVDDLNDWIGCLGGHPQCQSPNIDKLAARGVLFERSYCAAPACNPSRVSLLTGIRPWNSGIYVNPQPWRPVMKDAVTLPQHFMNNGYHVVGAGKIYHGRYEDPQSWHHYQKKAGDPKPTQKVLKDPHSKAGGIVWGVLDVEDKEMNDYATASYAIDYLQKDHDKPFFLACGIYRPHMPWQVPRKYYDMYPVDKVQLPNVPQDDLKDIPNAGIKMAKPQGDHKNITTSDNWKYAVQAYLASITFADAQVGRVMDALEKSQYNEDTIVILWGDHGWHLGEKEHWRKFALWEEATRAPLMISAPGITKPNSRSPRTVDFMDVYPTLSELCGLPIGDHLDGHSLIPLLKNPNAQWKYPALTTHGRGNHGVRTEKFRYIRYANGSEELYDHESDPNEWKNLAGHTDFEAAKKDLAKWLPKKEAAEAPYDKNVKTSKNKGNSKKKASK